MITPIPLQKRRRFGAWIRYGGPLTPAQIEFAAEHYAVGVLQPWETEAARRLKALRPDMTLLAYKCLSSTRSYEDGPIYSSGLAFDAAQQAGEHMFAHRRDGTRIQWASYPGHWQMAVWEPRYREQWVANVVAEAEDSPWDGIMADNDVFDDYYGLCLPLTEVSDLADIRAGLDALIVAAGSALNSVGRILVPNIAESRREPGRWARHSAFGGGFEEVWLAYRPDAYFDAATVLAQAGETRGPGLSLMRIATDGSDSHPNFSYGLAAFWIFGGGRTGASFSATGHDQYSATPFVPELDWDLGDPIGERRSDGCVLSRSFTNGWAAINIGETGSIKIAVDVPRGLTDSKGNSAPEMLTLAPHQGALYIAGDVKAAVSRRKNRVGHHDLLGAFHEPDAAFFP